MNKESMLMGVVALIVGILGGYLIFSISNAGKVQQPSAVVQTGGGSPTDYTQRIAQAEKVVVGDPKNLNAWISLGNDYFDTQQFVKSIEAYGKALEIEPNNPNILTDQGIMYKSIGAFDKAIANFEKANNINPSHLQSLFNLGIVYMTDMKQPDKAVKYWNKYLELDANSPTAMQIKAMMQQPGGAMPPPMK